MSDCEKMIEAAAKVQRLREAYILAKSAEDSARCETTNRLNELNRAQREYDEAAKSFKSLSPQQSDWGAKKHEVLVP